MPKLVSSFLRIEVSEKSARQLYLDRFKDCGWKVPVARSFALVFVPRYFFEYSVVTEEGDGTRKFVSDFAVSHGVFDPARKEIVGESFSEADLTNEFTQKVEFDVAKSGLGRSDAKRVAAILLSKEKKAPKESIEFLRFTQYYIPFWRFKLECEKEIFEMEINAFSGEFHELTPIKSKFQPWGRAVKETVSDLKKPGNWLSYIRESLSALFKAFKFLFTNRVVKGFFRLLRRNTAFQLLVLFIILAALLWIAFGQR